MKFLITCIWTLLLTLVGIGQSAHAAEALEPQRKETVALIGTGDFGNSFGPRLAALGYPVVYGSRNPESDKVKALLKKTGHGSIAMTQKDAAQQGDIVMLLVPWPAMETITQNLGDMSGKVMIDVSWPPVEFTVDGRWTRHSPDGVRLCDRKRKNCRNSARIGPGSGGRGSPPHGSKYRGHDVALLYPGGPG